MDNYDKKAESSQWEVSVDDEKHGLKICQRTSEDGLQAMKA